MTMRCIIVEDEPLAVERLRGYVQQLPLLQLVGTFDNATDALSYILTNQVDLVLLDIRLGGMSGIEMLETSAIASQVILTTAHQEFAVTAFELKVADYLLKPFTFARFVQAIERASTRISAGDSETERDFIFVKTEFRLERVRLRDILFIEGHDDYRRIHTLQKRILTPETFSDFEQRIASELVCRVHKSYMVAIDKIDTIERDRIGIRDVVIPISSTYRARFYSIIGRGST